MKLLSLISGGKDSWYALFVMMQEGHEISDAVTFIPKNPESYMLQHAMTPDVKEQFSKITLNIRHHIFEVSGEKEKEIEEMKNLLAPIVRKEKIDGIVCGALASEYQKQRIDFICEELGIRSYAPLWHKSEENLIKEIIDSAGFEFLIAAIGAEGIDNWHLKKITKTNLPAFISDLKKARCNVSGEGGEYETFVTKTPFFKIDM